MKKIILLLLIVLTFSNDSIGQTNELTVSDEGFYPEDIVITNNVAYVSGLGDGTIKMFDLNLENPEAETFAEAEEGYTQAWGVKSNGTILLSLLNNANFAGGDSGPSKLVQYDIASRTKTAEWDLPANTIGHTVSIVDGKYYVTDFASPRIMEVDPSTGTVNDSWFTSPDWDPTISGIGGTIYDNEGGFYISQGNKLWYLPISGGAPGSLQEVSVSGLDIIDADGITWVDSQNTLYYATNDTGDPANVGTVYKLVFSDLTTAVGSIVATGFDDSSGLWYNEDDGNEYLFVLESQFGALFGLNDFEPPFNIDIIVLESSSDNTVSVYNSFEDATLTGGQQAFYGAAGPIEISDDIEFPQFINFYDIDVTESGLTMTLFNNSDAADLVLPNDRFDRYYFAMDQEMPNVRISGGSPGLTIAATVTPLPAGYEIPLSDLFATGYPLPVTLPNGGFVLELGGGTDLTDLGQTISVDFKECSTIESLIVDDNTFFPEDIVIANNIAYVSGLGDGTIKMFDLNLENPEAETFAEAEEGYTQAWGVKSNGTILLSLLNNANFAGGDSGPSKLVQYDIASRTKTAEWDLPANTIGHTVSIVDGKYYVTDFASPRIMEVDPSTGTVNDSWFTSPDWDPTISGIGGTIYDNEGGFYISQGNKLWYLPISSGAPGTLQEVSVSGLDIIDADGITWVDSQNTLYYATNDTGDPANVGTVYKLVFSDVTTAVGSIVATGFDDSSGLWYNENACNEYLFVLESQFGGLFGLNDFEPPFNITVIDLSDQDDCSGLSEVQLFVNCSSDDNTYNVIITGAGSYQLTDNKTTESYSFTDGITVGPYPVSDGYDFTLILEEAPTCTQRFASEIVECTTLALDLLSFNGIAKETTNLLSWETAVEIDTDFFTLECSEDGVNFSSIAQISAKGGNNITAYEFADEENLRNILYYRLLETTTDGTTQVISGSIAITRELTSLRLLSLSPIPVSNEIQVVFTFNESKPINWFIYDIAGALIMEGQYKASSGNNALMIPVKEYPQGTYILQLIAGEQNITTKIIKQ